ncbi:hypothetical protein EDD86DRAFT_191502 [Gorgonomyces haynaldii]|nr:hypothetical protein EDD86DRAFT_191502 [Gorgonomyces haynaldii]
MLGRVKPRQLLFQILQVLLYVASALAMWKGASVLFYNESPIVVVLSESMTPAFERGDLLFLAHFDIPYQVGDIVVYKIKGQQIPIVHRVLELHEHNDGNISMLTKGDYNQVDDRGLYHTYNRGQQWIEPEDVMGRVYGHFPWMGMITIIINDYPQVKTALLLFLGLTALFNKGDAV